MTSTQPDSIKGPLHVSDAMECIAEAAQQLTKAVAAVSERGLILSLSKTETGYGVKIQISHLVP